ncbi:hypothetical protein [Micromonospora carbonacea]|uniref:Uncharacterized protein n=1 Tax=Micromonospora carbonacea TaxID=47853 RepID=A0A1C5AAG7_9ACTN|nr:hypothetical protein [Micromonospora carbonacea]SCF42223.1 hypothetical protein GA0070563_11253 [Micromonospora carbonacea]
MNAGQDADEQNTAGLLHAGFGLLARLTGVVAAVAAVGLLAGLTVAPDWKVRSIAALVVFGGLSVLLNAVSVAYRPEVER